MADTTPIFTTLLSGFGTFLTLAAEVGLLIIALTMVRPKRPDAATMLVIAAAINAFCTLLWPAFTTFVTPALIRDGSAASIGMTYAVFGLFTTLLRTVAWALLLFGIVKLVSDQPPRDPTRYG